MESIAKLLVAVAFLNLLSFPQSVYAIDREDRKEGIVLNVAKRKLSSEAKEEDPVKNVEIDDFMVPEWCQCPICREPYYNAPHCPQGLSSCGHSFCAPCLQNLSTRVPLVPEIKCPICRRVSPRPYAPNKDLLELVMGYRKQTFESKKKNVGTQQLITDKTEIERPINLVAELYNKEAQQRRCWCLPAEALVRFSWAFDMLSLFDAARLTPEQIKVAGWTFAQAGFLLSDLGSSFAATYLGRATEWFRKQLNSIEQDSEQYRLVRIDLEITNLHFLIQKMKLGLIDLNGAKHELDRLKAFLDDTTPRRRAQLEHGFAVYYQLREDFTNALNHTANAIAMTKRESGAEVIFYTLFRILADKAEKEGGISVALLKHYNSFAWNNGFEWKNAFDRVRKRSHGVGDAPETARALFDLGRLAISFGLFTEAREFMNRSVTVMKNLKAQFDKLDSEDKFKGLPEKFHFDLPPFVALAELAADELGREDMEVQLDQPSDESAMFSNPVFMAGPAEALVERRRNDPRAQPDYASAALNNLAFKNDMAEFLVGFEAQALLSRIRKIKAQKAQKAQSGFFSESQMVLDDVIFPGVEDGQFVAEQPFQFFEGI